MSSEDFNAEEFLSSTTASGPMSTEVVQCPEGVYRAQLRPITKDNFHRFQSEKGETYTTFEPLWEILDDTVRAELEREHVYVPQTIFLDFDQMGSLDTSKGKNVDLGRLREAVGQNDVEDWNFMMLNDAVANVRVKHRKDKNDVQRARVSAVTAAD